MFYELGIQIPKVEVGLGLNLEGTEYRVEVQGITLPANNGLEADELFVDTTSERLSSLGVASRYASFPGRGTTAAIVQGPDARSRTETAGFQTWDPAEYLVLSLAGELRSLAPAFLTEAHVNRAYGQLAVAFPAGVGRLLARFPLSTLTALARRLLREEVSIRDGRTIVEALLAPQVRLPLDVSRFIVFLPMQWAGAVVPEAEGDGPLSLDDYERTLRIALRSQLTHKHSKGEPSLKVIVLDPDLEQTLLSLGPTGRFDRQHHDALIDSVAAAEPDGDVVILTLGSTRSLLRREIEREFPRLAVLSYDDLDPSANLTPVSRIRLGLEDGTAQPTMVAAATEK